MIRVLLHGALGIMGRNVAAAAGKEEGIRILCGVDREAKPAEELGFPVYDSFSSVEEDVDVIIDFSVAPAVDALLDFAAETGIPLVLCTTGLSEEQLERVRLASERTAILRSANMSIGVNLLLELVKTAAEKLYEKGFDIELIEQHHRRKQDAPSGTALALAEAAEEGAGRKLSYACDRSERRMARPHEEIGISAVRGGTLPGVHEVIFAGEDEVISLNHTAYSRAIFAKGALTAAKFLAGREAGLYGMKDALA